jgi:hypothetical protein
LGVISTFSHSLVPHSKSNYDLSLHPAHLFLPEKD